jgi:hypothetical protein
MKNVKFEILENGKLIEEYVLTMPAEDIEAAHAEASKVWAEYQINARWENSFILGMPYLQKLHEKMLEEGTVSMLEYQNRWYPGLVDQDDEYVNQF